MDILLIAVVLIGLTAVGLAFIVLLPTVGQTLAAVFTAIVAEKGLAHIRGVPSDSDQRSPAEVLAEPAPVEEEHDDHDHHITPIGLYVGIYLVLIVLTGVTVAVSKIGLHPQDAVIAAVVVATIKATLVVAYFMHLKDGPGMPKLALATGIFFILVFFTLTMADVSTRAWGLEEADFNEYIDAEVDAGRTPAGWTRRTSKD